MAAKFEIFTDQAGEHQFRLKAANGEIVAQSQGYNSRDGAVKGARAVQTAAAEAPTPS